MLMEAVKQDIEMAESGSSRFLSSFSTINMLFLELNTKTFVKNGKVWPKEFTSNPALLNTTGANCIDGCD
jgi:hypothetical protein